MLSFGPIVTAMVTPFTEEKKLDNAALAKLIEHLILTGSSAIVVGGTTGESPTLTTDEKLALLETVLKLVSGRVKVIAGTGSNDTHTTLTLTKQAENLGVDGVMLVAPYYNRPSQLGLVKHFSTVVEQVSLPVMLYNVPARTGVNVTPEVMISLTNQYKHILAIKEASGDLNQIGYLAAQVGSKVAVYSGDDALTLPILALGGVGVVSVASHLAGSELKQMIDAFKSGAVEKAKDLHRSLLPLFQALCITTNPVPVKFLLSKKAIIKQDVRLPLIELEEHEKSFLDKLIAVSG
ncbi:MAG: hypothetical protein RLZ12_50 [Bacillota bacterium]|jgi:4-hydroxy-tetrahydrodipicolinate synthase